MPSLNKLHVYSLAYVKNVSTSDFFMVELDFWVTKKMDFFVIKLQLEVC